MTFGLIGDHYQFLACASKLVNMTSEELDNSIRVALESVDNFSDPNQREHIEDVIWLLEQIEEMSGR
jgi:hypothetical protein